MSVASFNADLKKFAKATDLELETVVRKVAFDVYKGITQKTPVDTGRAKANWNIGLGAIDSSVDESSTSTPQGQVGFGNLPPKGAGKRPIYITNNLPYIGRLENGYSKQAPKGMVRLTMLTVQRSIRNVVR